MIMTLSPAVSVVMPTFNHAKYIGMSIRSLQAQTFEDWELVIVDDGSTDDTREVVETFIRADRRIRYLFQENHGVGRLATTINKGVAQTTGRLVTMFGSDDIWPPDRLERQVPVFDDPTVVLVYARGMLINAQGESLGETPLPRFALAARPPREVVLRTLLLGNWLPQYTVLIRRSALDAIGGYLQPPPLLAEDYPTHLHLALQGEFRFIDAILGHYRLHPAQMTRRHKLEMSRTDAAFALQFYRSLDAKIRGGLNLTEVELSRHLEDRVNNAYFEEGRRALVAGDRTGARKLFIRALRVGNVRTKAKAAAGFTAALMGLDLERMARRAGRPPIR